MDGTAGPRVVGRYLLYDAIASGGMATVHLGRLVGPVGFSRTVAIKRMHDTLAQDPDFAAMFLDDARPATDIFAVSLVLWEALTGEDAFAYESEADLVYNMLESDAQPPSTLRPDIPRVLDDIILQGLNKEPAQRFITAKAMATALESAI